MDGLKTSTLGPKSGGGLPAAITGATVYASSPRSSPNLECIDVATRLFSISRNSRFSTASQLARRTLTTHDSAWQSPPANPNPRGGGKKVYCHRCPNPHLLYPL